MTNTQLEQLANHVEMLEAYHKKAADEALSLRKKLDKLLKPEKKVKGDGGLTKADIARVLAKRAKRVKVR